MKKGYQLLGFFFFYSNQSNGLDQDAKCEWIQDMFWRWTQQDWLVIDEGNKEKRGTGEVKLNLLCLSKKLM